MSPGHVMVRRAVEKIEPRRPSERPPRTAEQAPANDNRAPGLLAALLYAGGALLALAALFWWVFA